ncbi:MAG: hypothetical protein P8Q14_02360 [Vicingaceae bacterium]|nr:hypothetical protein [Vicingaceae bacterium]
MINNVYHLESQFTKSIGFDSGSLYLSSLQFDSIQGLRNKCDSSSKRSDIKIALNDIQKITLNDQSENVTLDFKNRAGKSKNYHLTGFPTGLKEGFCSELAKTAGIINHQLRENKTVDFSIHYLRIAGTVIGTSVIAYFASTPRTGRRSQMYRLAQDIGPIGVSIIGGIFLLFILYLMYKQMKNPANENVYSR